MTTDIEARLRKWARYSESPMPDLAKAACVEAADLLAEAREALRLYVNHAPTQPGGNAFTLENQRRAAEVLRKMEQVFLPGAICSKFPNTR